MPNLVVEQEFPEGLSDEEYQRFANRLDPCLEAYGARWMRSYLSKDRTRLICEFEGMDAESVRSSFRSADVPFVRVWSAEVFSR